jgi:hypothetical protein
MIDVSDSVQTEVNAAERGRADLLAWEAGKPRNFFAADLNLQHVLRRLLGDSAFADAIENLSAFGADCATVIDQAAKIEDRIGNHPRLDRYDGLGRRTERVEFHPNHDRAAALIWPRGMLALQAQPGRTVEQMALLYLLTHNGEAGHACAIACTAGLIRALQAAAAPEIRQKFLPPLLDPDPATMQHAAQFLTEVQGGSDVGANAVVARPMPDGTWRLRGEKWFCSNINADQFLVMARPEGAPDGTRGLGAFLVPRALDDGATNAFALRRLKDKLGTRTLASAEVDFQDALAYPIGAPDDGFKITVEFVLNTSRLMNAVSCAGMMRRASLEAAGYACARRAFGGPIAGYPLVQEAVADALSETYAAVASSFALAALLDRIETGAATEADRAAYRLLVNLNKYITSAVASPVIHRAIEVLGGNGAIESFSILPRLYRDMVVLESWEGTHNVLCLQALRDIGRYRLHDPLAGYVRAQLDTVAHPRLREMGEVVRAALDRALALVERLLKAEPAYAQAHARRMADALAYAAQGALLLAEAEWELDRGLPTLKPEVTAWFVNKHLRPGYDPLNDAEYLPRLAAIMAGA